MCLKLKEEKCVLNLVGFQANFFSLDKNMYQ